ncbi:MAG: cell envelope integrity protein TolA [Gammaproteobacteria bacterium]|nr:cell envelope integrity protein TolA [Gammaproteobacteria bacterium]
MLQRFACIWLVAAVVQSVAATNPSTEQLTQRFYQMIISKIQHHYIAPVPESGKDAQEGIECTAQIELIASGEILSIEFLTCDSDALKQAALRAIKLASPLPVPDNPEVFDQLRQLSIVFKTR